MTQWEGNPESSIHDVKQEDGDIIVTRSAEWLPAPFNVEFDVYLDEVWHQVKITLQ